MGGKGSMAKASEAGGLIRFPDLYAQSSEESSANAQHGIYFGMAGKMPCFIDFDSAINPHMFISGVTGSGKTYLMRSLMLKLSMISGFLILLIDFTGEYAPFVEFAGERETSIEEFSRLLPIKKSGILYVNLRGKGKEREKVEKADVLLGCVIENMRAADCANRVFVFLDEAWKLLQESKSLQILLREGRKYGHGLVFSSQLIEDVDFAMLSNAANLFILRLQNKQSLDRMARNYKLDQNRIQVIQKLGVGGCCVMQMLKSGKRSFFLIDRLRGVELPEFEKLSAGGKMQLEIEKERFEGAIRGFCGPGSLEKVMLAKQKEGYVELSGMVRLLAEGKARSRDILAAMRALGIGDDVIADSFAAATSASGAVGKA